MRIAIMQPYFFPYLGYFQLIRSADIFICLDDVAFIKKGWIHRNRLYFNGEIHWFSVPLHHASQFRSIRETFVCDHEFSQWKRKLLASVSAFYRKQAYFKEGLELLEAVLSTPYHSIADMATASLQTCCIALGISTPLKYSSDICGNIELRREARLVDICLLNGADTYINAAGGEALYTRSMFAPHGIRLEFLHPTLLPYTGQKRPFIPGLSVLDAIMCCGSQFVREELLGTYDIVEAA